MVQDHTYLRWSTYSNLSHHRHQRWIEPLLPRKKGSRHNPQHDDCPINRSIPSFSPEPAIEAVGVSHPLLMTDYWACWAHKHQHTISTFNTCLRGSTHRSLTDTGGGYSLEVVGFPYSTPRPPQLTVFTFHLRAPPGLQFNQILSTKPKC
jgi:hypothetical protein